MTAETGASRATRIEEQVAPLAERVARRVGCELVSVHYLFERGDWKLRIVLDRDGGVDVENCASVSRQLSAMLDVEDIIPVAYVLEVSSPGLDRELLVAADYKKYAGQHVRIQTVAGDAGGAIVRGKLRGLQGGSVIVEDETGERVELPRAEIAEARLEVEI